MQRSNDRLLTTHAGRPAPIAGSIHPPMPAALPTILCGRSSPLFFLGDIPEHDLRKPDHDFSQACILFK